MADYQASGGIRDAIARTAESVYANLSGPEREAARLLFLRLVLVTDDATESRRRVPLNELAGSADPVPSGDVLWEFVGQRLITVTEDIAEISHEALLTAWPRLREWIKAGRDGLRVRRRISDRAHIWQDAGRDFAVLPRGGELAIIRDWTQDPADKASLSGFDRGFVDAATAHERGEVEAERRRTRRLRQLVAALTALVLATVGLAGYAFAQRQAANTARDDADSRELAVEAAQLHGQDVSVAAQLSLAAYQTAATPAALASVLESSATPVAARLIDSTDVVEAAALSPDDRLLAAAGDGGTVRLWDVSNPRHPLLLALLTGPADTVYALAFSPDGTTLAAGTGSAWQAADRSCRHRDLSGVQPGWRHPGRRQLRPQVLAVECLPSGRAGPQCPPADRRHGLGELRRLQPGRHCPGRGQQRRHDPAVGRRDWQAHRRAPASRRGHFRCLGWRPSAGQRGRRGNGPALAAASAVRNQDAGSDRFRGQDAEQVEVG